MSLAGLSGCTVSNGTASADATKASKPVRTTTKQGGSAVQAGPKGSALTLLATIKIKGRSANTGYSRAQFGPAWADTDHNGCDQRDDILRRDLTHETFRARTHGCVVLSGTLADNYTGKTIVFSKASATAIQIDHVVPLQNAWVTGASGWTAAKRESLATDPLNLLAVDGPTNESKGSGDAATWLPRASYRCAYVARQVAVKAKYDAWMTKAEHTAIENILKTCPKQAVPVAGPVPLGAAGSGSTGSAPVSTSAPSTGSTASSGSGSKATVSAGAYCSPKGATGVTKAGTKMVCSSKNGDHPRWRSA